MEEDILNYLYQLSCFVGHPVGSDTQPNFSNVTILNKVKLHTITIIKIYWKIPPSEPNFEKLVSSNMLEGRVLYIKNSKYFLLQF